MGVVPRSRRWLTAVITACLVSVGLASHLAAMSPLLAQAGDDNVVAEFSGIPATFSGGDPEFTVQYDVQIVEMPDGNVIAIFSQRGSSDVLRGGVNEDGIPSTLKNPGKEKMTGGRMMNDRTLNFSYYEYISGGQKSTWSRVVFRFPAGALPFPTPTQEEAEPSPSPEGREEAEPASPAAADPTSEDEGGLPPVAIVALAVAGAAALIVARTRLFSQARTKRGCDEEYANWQNAERLYDESIKTESDAAYDKEEAQMAFDHAATDREVAKAKVFGKYAKDPAGYGKAQSEWKAKASEYDARVQEAQADLETAKSAHEAATKRRTELDAAREEAKKAYEECIGQQAAAAASSTTSGPTVGTAPTPVGGTQARGCKEKSIRNWRVLGRDSYFLVVDFQVRVVPTGTRWGRYQDAGELATSLKDIAEVLEGLQEGKLPGKAGDLQELKDKASELKDKAKTLATEGIDALLEEELKGAVKEQQEKINKQLKETVNDATGLGDALDALKKVPDLIKEPHKIPLEILRFTADLGAEVALFSGRVVEGTDMFEVQARLKTLQIDILWRSFEICANNRWRTGYEVLAPSGPTQWEDDWRTFGEVPGGNVGPYLEQKKREILGWCQQRMNLSSEELSKAMSTPPVKR